MHPMFTSKSRARLVSLALCGLTLWPVSTRAAGPKPGTAIGNAKEDDWAPLPLPEPMVLEPQTAVTAPVPDAALMRGVMWAFEPAPTEIRRQAIEDLGLLGDPRALNMLAQLALDPNPSFAKAGVRAVALIRHPRAEEILCNIVRHPTLTEELKVMAIGLLPMQRTDSSLRFLKTVVSGQYAWAVQGAARSALGELPATGRSGI